MRSKPPKNQQKQSFPARHSVRAILLHVILGCALAAVTVVVHFPAVGAGYTWDDDIWTHDNHLNFTSGGLLEIWTSSDQPDYWPLTRTVFWIGWQCWENNPTYYHAVNIILHALAVVFLWRVLRRLNLGEPGAYLSALIFGIHPVTVESVAWISECKNGLSMIFFLWAILAYVQFDDDSRPRRYLLALLAAAGALLAKTAVVMLPVLILLLLWWRHGKITRHDIFRTTPFFLLSLILGLVTIWFQYHNAICGDVVRPEGLASRIASVGWVVWFYLYKIVVPINLAMVYPRWDVSGQQILSYVPLVLLVGLCIALWFGRNRRGKGPLVALGSFIIILAPVLGLLEMSYSRYSLVADHLQYPGMPGIIALIGGLLGATWAWVRRKHNTLAQACVAVVISAIVLTLSVLTWQQASIYQSELTLWSHTIALNDRAWSAYSCRGNYYSDIDDWERAITDYIKAVAIKPDEAGTYVNRGNAYVKLDQYDLAFQDYDRAIALKPGNAKGYHNRGMTFGRLHQYDEAIRDLTKSIELKSDYFEAYSDRATAYYGIEAFDLAIRDYTKAIELKNDDVEVHISRGNVYVSSHDYNRAMQDYNRALELKPDSAKAFNHRGRLYVSMGDHARAIEDFTRAIDLDPYYVGAYRNRGIAYGRLRDFERAIHDLTRAIEINPDDVEAYFNRGVAFGMMRDNDRALQDYDKAIELQPGYVKAYTNRGNLFYKLGDYAQAISDQSKAIEIQPDYADAYNNRGAANYTIKDYPSAVNDYSKVIELQPDYARAYYNRANAYITIGAPDKAREDIERYQQLGGQLTPRFLKMLGQAPSPQEP